MTQRVVACALAAASCAIGHAALARVAGEWRGEPEMAAARAAHAVAATAEAIYVLGGTGADGQPVAEIERFDGKSWTRETTLPMLRGSLARSIQVLVPGS